MKCRSSLKAAALTKAMLTLLALVVCRDSVNKTNCSKEVMMMRMIVSFFWRKAIKGQTASKTELIRN